VERFKIEDIFIQEAFEYAKRSRAFTSDRHDFHEGGLEAKQQKMFEGKLGEKIVKQLFMKAGVSFEEDMTSHESADDYDFLVKSGKKLDVKTRTKDFHIRTLELKEQIEKRPKELYVSVRLFTEAREGYVIGWTTRERFLEVGRVENQGYLDNYVLYDRELYPWEELVQILASPR
jgi:hypothetical protein